MPGDTVAIQEEDIFLPMKAPERKANEHKTKADGLDISSAEEAMLGYVNFDGGAADNTTSQVMASADHQKHFRREVYVGIKDTEQNIEFLGRIVQGPFHTPHEAGANSKTRKRNGSHPESTKSQPAYDVYGNIEILGQLLQGQRVIATSTRPRPYSEIYIFPPERLRKLLELEGNMLLGSLMGYEEQRVEVRVHSDNKNILPLNVGIFGTVGSGKSNTVQVLVEEASSADWACVIIDVEGEYVRMSEPQDHPDMNHILRESYSMAPQGREDFRVYVPSSGTSDAENPSPFK